MQNRKKPPHLQILVGQENSLLTRFILDPNLYNEPEIKLTYFIKSTVWKYMGKSWESSRVKKSWYVSCRAICLMEGVEILMFLSFIYNCNTNKWLDLMDTVGLQYGHWLK